LVDAAAGESRRFGAMTILVIASERDPAGLNIASCLSREYGFDRSTDCPDARITRKEHVLLARVEEESIHVERIDSIAAPESVIFASRHTSEKGQPCLTVHCPGNVLNEAPYGGNPKSLALVDPNRMRAALISLSESREELSLPYLVSLEATHHGPTELPAPCMFVEIGSSAREWSDPNAARAVAKAIWTAATRPSEGTLAVGFGGGHYSWKHTESVLKDRFAFGHILSKYFFEDFDTGLVELAFRKTVGECHHGVIDKKGVRGAERKILLEYLQQSGRECVMM